MKKVLSYKFLKFSQADRTEQRGKDVYIKLADQHYEVHKNCEIKEVPDREWWNEKDIGIYQRVWSLEL